MKWIDEVFQAHAGFLGLLDLASLSLTCIDGRDIFKPTLSQQLWSSGCRQVLGLSRQAASCTNPLEMAVLASYIVRAALRPLKLLFFHLRHCSPREEAVALPAEDVAGFLVLAAMAEEQIRLQSADWPHIAVEMAIMARALQRIGQN